MWRKTGTCCWLVLGCPSKRTQKSPWLVCPGKAVPQETPLPQDRSVVKKVYLWWRRIKLVKSHWRDKARSIWSGGLVTSRPLNYLWEAVAAGGSSWTLEELVISRVFKKDKEAGSLAWKIDQIYLQLLNVNFEEFSKPFLVLTLIFVYQGREGEREGDVKSQDFNSSIELEIQQILKNNIWMIINYVFVTWLRTFNCIQSWFS